MRAKEYLSQTAVLTRRIKQVEDRIEELRTEVSSPKAIRYDKDNIQSSPAGDALAAYMVRIEAETLKLIALKEEYLTLYSEIRDRINAVMPGLYADVLFMRYIEQKPFVRIADELGFGYEWTCRLHGRALQKFTELNPDVCQ